MTRAGLLAAMVLSVAAAPAQSQNAAALISSGVRAYENLELDNAAGLLRRGLAAGGDALGLADRVAGLTYLGATEVIRGNRDSARAVFRRLVRSDPRHRMDPLVFPPEVSDVYESIRLTNKVAIVEAPARAEFLPGETGFLPWVIVSSFSTVGASVQLPDGTVVRSVYAGPVSDSLRLEWDARDGNANLVATGRYVLAVETSDASGSVQRLVRVPLDVTVVPGDTLPHPAPPDPASLLPERLGAAAGIESLVGGLGVAVAVVGISSAISDGAGLSTIRFGVGAAAAGAGFLGFLRQRPGTPIPDNVIANEAVRDAWRARVQDVVDENAIRRDNANVTVLAGPPQVIEREP